MLSPSSPLAGRRVSTAVSRGRCARRCASWRRTAWGPPTAARRCCRPSSACSSGSTRACWSRGCFLKYSVCWSAGSSAHTPACRYAVCVVWCRKGEGALMLIPMCVLLCRLVSCVTCATAGVVCAASACRTTPRARPGAAPALLSAHLQLGHLALCLPYIFSHSSVHRVPVLTPFPTSCPPVYACFENRTTFCRGPSPTLFPLPSLPLPPPPHTHLTRPSSSPPCT